MPPHWKNCASVSMSLVTRATSPPRRSSPWSARLKRWMWPISRSRKSYSARSLRTLSRYDAWRNATPEINTATAPKAARRATRPTSTGSPVDWPTMPLSIACWMRIGTTTRPPDPRAASSERDPQSVAQDGRRGQAATNRGDRAFVGVDAGREPHAHDAPARSASKASTISRYSATVSSNSSCEPWPAIRPSARNTTSSASAIVDGREAMRSTVASSVVRSRSRIDRFGGRIER